MKQKKGTNKQLIFHRGLKKICSVLVQDNEKQVLTLEYLEETSSQYPYQTSFKRIQVRIDQDVEIIRFTEKYDSQDQLLYEGDVIKESDPLSGRTWIGVVSWDQIQGQFIEKTTGSPLNTLKLTNTEKIGNEFEEPQLVSVLENQIDTENPTGPNGYNH
ncbi:hypothetical protein ACFLZP_00695 [Patescibacteria group bacterium]